MTAEGLVDEITVTVQAGDGGHGSASFHREKYKPRGGPDGGNGGDGGSVVLMADERIDTLAGFRDRRLLKAESGAPGAGGKRGKAGRDLRVRVPVGTVVVDLETQETLADLAVPGTSYVVAPGGAGGRGNAALSGPQDRAPNFAERGEPGVRRKVKLDLRLVADAGLLGLPNAGKSTLLRSLSAAKPKVAAYPFTTLAPHLGVVDSGDERYVVADLPGLIEGAAGGRGLGTRFLRHAQRCVLLVLVVDAASPDPVADLQTVYGEVEAFSEELASRVAVVVVNKVDLQPGEADAVRAWAAQREMDVLHTSALTGDGISALEEHLLGAVARARAERPRDESFALFQPVQEDRIVVERDGEGFRVSSTRVERAVSVTPLANPRAVRHLQRRFNALGVERALREAGAVEGDEVYIGEHTFEYIPTDPEPRGGRRGRRT